MPVHNPECTHGAAHAYSACRDRQGTPLKMVETLEPVVVAQSDELGSLAGRSAGSDAGQVHQVTNTVLTNDQLTPADREALSRALAGLAPVAVQELAGAGADPS